VSASQFASEFPVLYLTVGDTAIPLYVLRFISMSPTPICQAADSSDWPVFKARFSASPTPDILPVPDQVLVKVRE
jgi:hypothetical protein